MDDLVTAVDLDQQEAVDQFYANKLGSNESQRNEIVLSPNKGNPDDEVVTLQGFPNDRKLQKETLIDTIV